MAHAQAMLDAYPRDFNLDTGQLARTIETLVDCANTCIQCADACLSETDPGKLTKCIRLDLDCADVCEAASRVISRQTEYDANVSRQLLGACIAVCTSCADECESHAPHMGHCRICAQQCRQCEQECRALLVAMR